MKRADIRKANNRFVEQAEQIVYLWLSFADKNNKLDGIAGEGRSMMGAVSDFLGEIPKGSDFKPETLGGRVEKQRRIPITKEERIARDAIMGMSLRSRAILTLWPQLRKKENPETGKLHTVKDVIKVLRVCGVMLDGEEEFFYQLELLSELLVAVAAKKGLVLEVLA